MNRTLADTSFCMSSSDFSLPVFTDTHSHLHGVICCIFPWSGFKGCKTSGQWMMILGRDNTVLFLTMLKKYCSLTGYTLWIWRSFYSSSNSPPSSDLVRVVDLLLFSTGVVYLMFWEFLLKMYLGGVCVWGKAIHHPVSRFVHLRPYLVSLV